MQRFSSGEIHFQELQRAELHEALPSGQLRCLWLDLENYDGVSNLGMFLYALENAMGRIVLSGRAASTDTIGQFLSAISSNKNIKALSLGDILLPAVPITLFCKFQIR